MSCWQNPCKAWTEGKPCASAEAHDGPCVAPPSRSPSCTFTIRPKPGCDRSLEDAVKHLASLLEKPLRVEVVGPSIEQFAAPLMATLDTTFDGSFSDALRALKDGKKVARKGWAEEGAWLTLVPKITALGSSQRALVLATQTTAKLGWVASEFDLLADDWEVLP